MCHVQSLWQLVFSTYVEVIPGASITNGKILGILHVCGGDPDYLNANNLDKQYSPRMWR